MGGKPSGQHSIYNRVLFIANTVHCTACSICIISNQEEQQTKGILKQADDSPSEPKPRPPPPSRNVAMAAILKHVSTEPCETSITIQCFRPT